MPPRQGEPRDVLSSRTIAAYLLLAVALLLILGSQWGRVCRNAPHSAAVMEEGRGVPQTPPNIR